MGLVINGDFEIRCVQCDEKYTFTPDEVDFQEIDREETVIGIEILYEWTYKMGCDCTNSMVICTAPAENGKMNKKIMSYLRHR
ncbi:MAG: hypothetical protein Q8M94_01665 [Ignavibacteria bacterium]|nr:hypothetical protein [Ignavibacteria bacterium]